MSFAQGFGPLALAPMFPQMMQSFNCDLAGVVRFTGVCILVLGFSNFIWFVTLSAEMNPGVLTCLYRVLIQSSFGRRPVLIISTLICLVSNIWRAVAKDYGSFMGACILNGIGAGPAEVSILQLSCDKCNKYLIALADSSKTAQPTIIADVMFLHERGFWNTLYFACYFGSLMGIFPNPRPSIVRRLRILTGLSVGPVISGPMAEHIGWRSFWWLNVGLLSLLLILLLFLFPETKWHRAPPNEVVDVHASTSDRKEITQNIEDADESQSIAMAGANPTRTAERDPYLHLGYPSKKQFTLWQNSADPFRSILTDLWIPWKLFAFPIVEFSSFVVSWSASSFLTLNLTQSQNFAAPPYNFSSQSIGFMNLATFVGSMIGLLSNGPLSDWIADRATKKNKGIREPEMRLPALIPYVLIMLVGNFVVAFGYQYKWDWRVR